MKNYEISKFDRYFGNFDKINYFERNTRFSEKNFGDQKLLKLPKKVFSIARIGFLTLWQTFANDHNTPFFISLIWLLEFVGGGWTAVHPPLHTFHNISRSIDPIMMRFKTHKALMCRNFLREGDASSSRAS